MRDPFSLELDIAVIADDISDEPLELKHNLSPLKTFLVKSFSVLEFILDIIPSGQQNSTPSHCPICLDLPQLK